MSKKFLETVYDLSTPEQTRDLYDAWSGTYDAEIMDNGYATPARIADALARHLPDKTSEILDFGCGTGISGQVLVDVGFKVIDGADLSADMLDVARQKGIYRALSQVAPGDPVPGGQGGYQAITAMGVIGNGAAPVEVFDMLINALNPGGIFALSFNDNTLRNPEFEDRLRHHVQSGNARLLFQEYGPHLPGIGIKSNVYLLEKL